MQRVLDSHPKISITWEEKIVRFWHEFDTRCHEVGEGDDPYGIWGFHDAKSKRKFIGDYFKMAFRESHIPRKTHQIPACFCYWRTCPHYIEAKYIGDKLPSFLLYMDWMREKFSGARFIICERNWEDVFESLKKNVDPSIGVTDIALKEVVDLYKQKTESQFIYADCHFVKLEELKSDPSGVMDSVAQFLGVDNDFDVSMVRS